MTGSLRVRYPPSLRFLITATHCQPALHRAIRANDVATVDRLLKSGSNSNEKDSLGNTPLVTALTPTALLEPLGPVEEQKRRAEVRHEMTARKKIIRMLLQAGADANTPGPDGITPLMALAQWGFAPADDVRIARELIARGATVNARSDAGDTALIVAKRRGKKELVRLLEGGS